MATLTTASPSGTNARIPWYLWCAALAVTSVTIGAHWDVSWHRSIGRDTFWTPAHMAIYLCGVLAGICSGYLILFTTFLRPPQMVASSVRVFGLRGPFGAFLAAWGGVAMLTSAPFDNWWHNAYGLDVKIVSPPHTVLMLGIWAVVPRCALPHRCRHEPRRGRRRPSERTVPPSAVAHDLSLRPAACAFHVFPHGVHLGRLPAQRQRLYRLHSGYAALLRRNSHRLAQPLGRNLDQPPSTPLFVCGLILILPLFPAEPKLGPVYQHRHAIHSAQVSAAA